MRIHGDISRAPRRVPLSPLHEGRFGRMFRKLPPCRDYSDAELESLAERMREDSGGNTGSWGQPNAQPEGGDNPDIPAGYTYFGQFVDHDITFDPTSHLQRRNDPDSLHDFRSPRFDLDSLYGSGPKDEPFQFDQHRPGRMLIGSPREGEFDLPRNSQQVALIGDPRNDENTIVSQLQLVFLRFHDRVADRVDADGIVPAHERFFEAQRLVRWHYQWVVVHDYLERICGRDFARDLFHVDRRTQLPDMDLRYYRPQKNPYMPVEFSVAAFRFGHSQVRVAYNLSDRITNIPIFAAGDDVAPTADLRGGKQLPEGWTIDWSHFLPLSDRTPQPSRLIDGHLTPALFDLPRLPADESQSLAFRNLKRGQALQLPSGQDVAKHIKARVLSGGELGGALDPTPLWFYVLKEAELSQNEAGQAGTQLGPVGARIVAEVLLGLLRLDPQSYFNIEPGWEPTLPMADPEVGFTLADLVRFATA